MAAVNLLRLRQDAAGCRMCPLWANATQTVTEEIRACRPWLDGELEAIHPEVIVALGATAAQALLGRDARVTTMRGTFVPSDLAPFVTATVHPSSILRSPDDASRKAAYREFVRDLAAVATAIEAA